MGLFALGMGIQAVLLMAYACCVASGRAARFEEQMYGIRSRHLAESIIGRHPFTGAALFGRIRKGIGQ